MPVHLNISNKFQSPPYKSLGHNSSDVNLLLPSAYASSSRITICNAKQSLIFHLLIFSLPRDSLPSALPPLAYVFFSKQTWILLYGTVIVSCTTPSRWDQSNANSTPPLPDDASVILFCWQRRMVGRKSPGCPSPCRSSWVWCLGSSRERLRWVPLLHSVLIITY